MMLMFIGRVSGKHLLLTVGITLIPVLILVLTAVVRHKSGDAVVAKPKAEGHGHLFARVDTWINRVAFPPSIVNVVVRRLPAPVAK